MNCKSLLRLFALSALLTTQCGWGYIVSVTVTNITVVPSHPFDLKVYQGNLANPLAFFPLKYNLPPFILKPNMTIKRESTDPLCARINFKGPAESYYHPRSFILNSQITSQNIFIELSGHGDVSIIADPKDSDCVNNIMKK